VRSIAFIADHLKNQHALGVELLWEYGQPRGLTMLLRNRCYIQLKQTLTTLLKKLINTVRVLSLNSSFDCGRLNDREFLLCKEFCRAFSVGEVTNSPYVDLTVTKQTIRTNFELNRGFIGNPEKRDSNADDCQTCCSIELHAPERNSCFAPLENHL
jgi:hypothetical protein